MKNPGRKKFAPNYFHRDYMNQKEIYDKVWTEIDEENPRPFLEYKFSLIRGYLEGNCGKALDIGCGDGFFTLKLLELGYEVDAIDVSPEAINSTRNRVEKRGLSEFVRLINKNIFEFQPGHRYDVILCFEVLEHIMDDLKVLKKINSWLKDKGLLIISVPHRQDLWNYSDDVGGHYRRYTKESLFEKVNEANLEVEKIFDYGFPFIRLFVHGFFVPSAKRHNSQITPPKNSYFFRKVAQILNKLFKVDSIFINNNRGITIVTIAKKA